MFSAMAHHLTHQEVYRSAVIKKLTRKLLQISPMKC